MPATTNVYDQHRAAFSNVSAWVIFREREQVATVTMKFPRDGAGRLYAYVHWHGTHMVRGFAGGYGCDKQSTACADAARKMVMLEGEYPNGEPHFSAEEREAFNCFKAALEKDDGHYWYDCLRDAGFRVIQAV